MQHTALWSELQPLVERRCAERGGARQVADLAGLSPAQLSRYRNGHKAPSIEVLDRLARGFGYRVEFDLVPVYDGGPESSPALFAAEPDHQTMTPTLDQIWRRVVRLLKAKVMRTQGEVGVLARSLGMEPKVLAHHLEGVTPSVEIVNRAARHVGMTVQLDLLPDREDTGEFLQMMRQVMVLAEPEQVALLELSRRLPAATDGSLRVVRSHLDAALKELGYFRSISDGG